MIVADGWVCVCVRVCVLWVRLVSGCQKSRFNPQERCAPVPRFTISHIIQQQVNPVLFSLILFPLFLFVIITFYRFISFLHFLFIFSFFPFLYHSFLFCFFFPVYIFFYFPFCIYFFASLYFCFVFVFFPFPTIASWTVTGYTPSLSWHPVEERLLYTSQCSLLESR